ncbi:MAG: hypothetical protein AAF747_01140 [Planctomycetota bacterium]
MRQNQTRVARRRTTSAAELISQLEQRLNFEVGYLEIGTSTTVANNTTLFFNGFGDYRLDGSLDFGFRDFSDGATGNNDVTQYPTTGIFTVADGTPKTGNFSGLNTDWTIPGLTPQQISSTPLFTGGNFGQLSLAQTFDGTTLTSRIQIPQADGLTLEDRDGQYRFSGYVRDLSGSSERIILTYGDAIGTSGAFTFNEFGDFDGNGAIDDSAIQNGFSIDPNAAFGDGFTRILNDPTSRGFWGNGAGTFLYSNFADSTFNFNSTGVAVRVDNIENMTEDDFRADSFAFGGIADPAMLRMAFELDGTEEAGLGFGLPGIYQLGLAFSPDQNQAHFFNYDEFLNNPNATKLATADFQLTAEYKLAFDFGNGYSFIANYGSDGNIIGEKFLAPGGDESVAFGVGTKLTDGTAQPLTNPPTDPPPTNPPPTNPPPSATFSNAAVIGTGTDARIVVTLSDGSTQEINPGDFITDSDLELLGVSIADQGNTLGVAFSADGKPLSTLGININMVVEQTEQAVVTDATQAPASTVHTTTNPVTGENEYAYVTSLGLGYRITESLELTAGLRTFEMEMFGDLSGQLGGRTGAELQADSDAFVTDWGTFAYVFPDALGNVMAAWTTPTLNGEYFTSQLNDPNTTDDAVAAGGKVSATTTPWGIHVGYQSITGQFAHSYFAVEDFQWRYAELADVTEGLTSLPTLADDFTIGYERSLGGLFNVTRDPASGNYNVTTWSLNNQSWRVELDATSDPGLASGSQLDPAVDFDWAIGGFSRANTIPTVYFDVDESTGTTGNPIRILATHATEFFDTSDGADSDDSTFFTIQLQASF